MSVGRIVLYDHDWNPLGDLDMRTVEVADVVEEVNGEHSLTIVTSAGLDIGTYAITRDERGKLHEWCVNEAPQEHDGGAHAMASYKLPWSLYADLEATDGTKRWAAAEDGTLDPISASEALPIIIADCPRWEPGIVDLDTEGAASLYDAQVWDYLAKAVEVWGGEIDARIEVDGDGTIHRYVDWLAHVGPEDVTRRFEYGRELTRVSREPEPGPYFCGIVPRGGSSKTDSAGVDYSDRVGIESETDGHVRYLLDDEAKVAFRRSDGHGGHWYPLRVVNYDLDLEYDAEELLNKATPDVFGYTHPRVTYEADATELARGGMDVYGAQLGEEVHVVDRGFNPGVALRVPGRITRLEHSLLDEGSVRVTLGQLGPSVSDAVRGLARQTLTTVERRVAVVEAEAARLGVLDVEVITADIAKLRDVSAEDIRADRAKLGSIDTNQIDADHAVIRDLDANYAHITDGKIDNATIGHARVDGLAANYAVIDLANVNNAWIVNGVVKDASITDAKIVGMSANKLTAGTINAGVIRVINLSADNITAGTLNGERIGEGTLSLGKLDQEVYTAAEVDDILEALNARIDSAIQTWTGDAVPLLSNYPAEDWGTDAVRAEHVGDIYYVVNSASQADGYSYRFVYDRTTGQYSWQLIQDSAVTAALQQLIDLQGDVSGLKAFQSQAASWQERTDSSVASVVSEQTRLEARVGGTLESTAQLWRATATEDAPEPPTRPVVNEGDRIVDVYGMRLVADDGSGLVTDGLQGEWQVAVPEWSDGAPNYWYCWQYVHADGTYSWSDPVLDRAVSASQRDARAALQGLVTKVEVTTFNEVRQEVGENSATITRLSETVATKADGSAVTTLTNEVSAVRQTATENGASISRLNDTVTENERDIEEKHARLSQTVDGVESRVGSLESATTTTQERLTQAESVIQQHADAISLSATKVEVEGAAAQADAALEAAMAAQHATETYRYEHTFVRVGDTYTFTAQLWMGARDVTAEVDADRFVWWLRNEDGERLWARGVSMSISGAEAGYRASVIGGYEDEGGYMDTALVTAHGLALVTDSGEGIAARVIWEG